MSEPRPPKTFRELREAAKLSQDKLAHCIGVTGKTISNWERGISIASLTIPQTKALCRTLKLQLDDLPDDFSSE